ncbi:MAG TPA: DUF3793 family protein [Geobacteraceae bacterium]
MAESRMSSERLSTPLPWNSLATRFPDSRACLASLLALESAEVIAGVKPANLVNIANRMRPCGQNPYELWYAHGEALLAGTGLQALVLLDRGDALLLYLYRSDLLQDVLVRKPVATILERCGYRNPASIPASLAQLQARVAMASFPHEIGIFLGYPLKDVLAFMGQIDLPFACQGPWKIYGKPEQSLELADCYRQCRYRMARHLQRCADPEACLRLAA